MSDSRFPKNYFFLSYLILGPIWISGLLYIRNSGLTIWGSVFLPQLLYWLFTAIVYILVAKLFPNLFEESKV